MRVKCIRLIALIIICSVLSAGCSTGLSESTEPYNIIDCNVRKLGADVLISEKGSSLVCGSAADGIPLEYVSVELKNPIKDGEIEYQLHVQSVGWTDWIRGSQMAEVGKQIEAVRLQLTSDMAQSYDLCYRVYSEGIGWTAWTYNGETAGTEGLSKGIESIEIKLVVHGGILPEESIAKEIEEKTMPELDYRIYLQDTGWLEKGENYAGIVSGAKKAEGFSINVSNSGYSGSVFYRQYTESYGWLDWTSDGVYSGKYGESKRAEGIQIYLTDELEENFDIYYRVYVLNRGWLGWASNGKSAGTSDMGLMIEAYQVILTPKGADAPGDTAFASIAVLKDDAGIDPNGIVNYAVSRLEAVGRYYVADTEAFLNRNGENDESGKTYSFSDVKAYCDKNLQYGYAQADISQAGDDVFTCCSDKILEFYSDKDPKAAFYIEYAGVTMDNELVFKCYYKD